MFVFLPLCAFVWRLKFMPPWILFSLALALALLGVLTIVRSPTWSPWQLAVLAGEFGHWFALLALTVAVAAWTTRSAGTLITATTVVVSVTAALLLLKPAWQAWRLGTRLPKQLTAQFGAPAPAPTPFRFTTLFFGRGPAPVAARTLEMPGGLLLDFYPPANRPDGQPAPCVLMIHGGGWDNGDREQLPKVNHWLAQRGYAVAALSYRLAPRAVWPAQRDDVLAALAFLKAQAGALGLDPTNFVLLGRSAGGQIALCVAYAAGDPAIRGVIGLYPPTDLIFGYVNTHENDMLRSPALMRQFLGGTPDSARANYESASAIFQATDRSPPTLLLHGTLDALAWYRHSERLDARLAELSVPRLYLEFPWATHAFDYNLHGPGGQLTTYALETFLTRITSVSPSG